MIVCESARMHKRNWLPKQRLCVVRASGAAY